MNFVGGIGISVNEYGRFTRKVIGNVIRGFKLKIFLRGLSLNFISDWTLTTTIMIQNISTQVHEKRKTNKVIYSQIKIC